MHRPTAFLHFIRQLFYLMPDLVAFLLTAIGVAIIFMTETLKKLERHPNWRKFIVCLCICLGMLSFISNQIQKAEDKRTAEVIHKQNESDRTVLTQQITTLIGGSQSQATSADVKLLSDGISAGFQRLESAIRGTRQGIDKQPASVNSEVAPESIRFTQKRVASADPDNPYALQIIVQSDTSFSPVGLSFQFSKDISKINFFLAGQPMMMMTQSFVRTDDATVGIVKVGYPALGPDTPMVVTVLSHTDTKLVSIEKISGTLGSIR